MSNPSFSLQILTLILLALLSPLALYTPTLAMPQPASPSLSLLTPRTVDARQARTISSWRSIRDRCNRRDTCSDWVEGPDYPSFEGAPEKQAKVEARRKKRQDVDPDDKDFCAGEVCDKREECVKMHGHEREVTSRRDWWFTCCPSDLPVAGYKGKCCKEVKKKNGVCIV